MLSVENTFTGLFLSSSIHVQCIGIKIKDLNLAKYIQEKITPVDKSTVRTMAQGCCSNSEATLVLTGGYRLQVPPFIKKP